MTTQAVFAANGKVKLERQFAAANIDAKTLNIFSYAFKPDGSGFDGVLDKVQIAGFNHCNVSICAVSYRVNGIEYARHCQISANGFNWTISNLGQYLG